jgi:hypothetical protein
MTGTFVGDALVGGLIYDVVKLGVSGWGNIVRVALKSYLLTEEEIEILANGLEKSNLPEDATKKDIEMALRGNNRANEIVEKINNSNQIINYAPNQGRQYNAHTMTINEAEKKN